MVTLWFRYMKQQMKTAFWWLRIPRPKPVGPKQAFPNALNEIVEFGEFVKKQNCPSCKKNGSFHLNTFERGKEGWECTVWCDCGVAGVFNNTGFHVKRLTPPTREAKTKK